MGEGVTARVLTGEPRCATNFQRLDQFSLESEGEQVLLEALPMLIEAGFQNAGLVAMELLGYSSLPVGINWSTMLRVPDADEALRLRSVQTGAQEDAVTVHDVLVVGEDDAPVLALKGLNPRPWPRLKKASVFRLSDEQGLCKRWGLNGSHLSCHRCSGLRHARGFLATFRGSVSPRHRS